MSASMYSISIPVFVRMLGNLSAILDKALAHAEARKIDPDVFLNARLAPDMFPLTRQVQIACDFAKGVSARLSGQEPPKWDDNEKSFADLKGRIARTLDFLKHFVPAQIDGSEEREINLTIRGEQTQLQGLPYLLHMGLPNFYFHVTTAYAILRHHGVDLGKRDYTGTL